MSTRSVRIFSAVIVLSADATAAQAVDFSAIHGYWEPDEGPCSESHYSWLIDRKGASPFDSVCKVRSSSRKGNTYTLSQTCDMEGEANDMLVDIKRISSRHVEIYGMPYRRCPKPD